MNNEKPVGRFYWESVVDGHVMAVPSEGTPHYNNDDFPLYTTPQTKPLSDADLTLILEVLIDSYDDTNRCYLEYKTMWEKSPTRKARIDGMKRMVDKHANAIEKIEAIIERHGIK